MLKNIYEERKRRLIFNSYISPDSTPGDSLPPDDRPLGKNKSSGFPNG